MKKARVVFLTNTSAIILLAATVATGCKAPEIKAGKQDGRGGAGTDDQGRGGRGGDTQNAGDEDAAPPFELPDLGPPETISRGVDDGGGCNTRDVKYSGHIPTVALLLDRSGSMNQTYEPGPPPLSRWQVLKQTLLDPTIGLLKPNEAGVRFGIATYTGLKTQASCPWIEEVGFALNNYDAASRLLAATGERVAGDGETPTSESIAQLTAKLLADPDVGSKYIVLATDGEPDTCPGVCEGRQCPVPDRAGWPRNPQCGQDRSVAAVQAAFAKGIKTFVIALGDEVGAEHLQALANAGAGLPVAISPAMMEFLTGNTCKIPAAELKAQYMPAGMNAQFFAPANQKALAEAFKTVIDSVRSCKVTLTGMVVLANAAQGKVSLDGEALKYMDANGWRMNSPTELEVLGTKCDDLLHKPEAALQIAFPCAVYNE
jgi:hypothetical protein